MALFIHSRNLQDIDLIAIDVFIVADYSTLFIRVTIIK